MAVEQYGRKDEVEGADETSDYTRRCVDVDVAAGATDAELGAEGCIAVEATSDELDDREHVSACMNDNLDPDGGEEKHEGIVVFDSDAVIDPRAVVVVPLYALVADEAVAGANCLDHPALRAKVSRIDVS